MSLEMFGKQLTNDIWETQKENVITRQLSLCQPHCDKSFL